MPTMELPDQVDDWRMLSVRQPWADFLVPGDAELDKMRRHAGPEWADRLPKTIENRKRTNSWRGWTLIHASGWPRFDPGAMSFFGGMDPKSFLYGAVLGAVYMHDCTPDSIGRGKPNHWAEEDTVWWHMTQPVRLRLPLRGVTGALGLIRPHVVVLNDALQQLHAQLTGGRHA